MNSLVFFITIKKVIKICKYVAKFNHIPNLKPKNIPLGNAICNYLDEISKIFIEMSPALIDW